MEDDESKREAILNDPTECWWRIECREAVGLNELLPCPIRKIVRSFYKRKEEERLNRESGLFLHKKEVPKELIDEQGYFKKWD